MLFNVVLKFLSDHLPPFLLDTSCSVVISRFNQPPPPVQATTEYVDFLLAVASDPTSSVAQVLASMVPCMRLYAFIGKVRRGYGSEKTTLCNSTPVVLLQECPQFFPPEGSDNLASKEFKYVRMKAIEVGPCFSLGMAHLLDGRLAKPWVVSCLWIFCGQLNKQIANLAPSEVLAPVAGRQAELVRLIYILYICIYFFAGVTRSLSRMERERLR